MGRKENIIVCGVWVEQPGKGREMKERKCATEGEGEKVRIRRERERD